MTTTTTQHELGAVVDVDADALELDDATPAQDGTVRCSILGETGDGMLEVRLYSGHLERVWVVRPDAIRAKL